MRAYLLFGLLMVGLAGPALAQDGSGFVTENKSLSINVFDQNGKAFVNPATEVTGSPFLANDWKNGTVVAASNRRYDSVKIRLNLFSQQVHFLNNSNLELALDKGYIREILLPDPKTGIPARMDFQNGFPAVDEQGINNFYEVLVKGKISLLLSIRKIIAQEKDEMSGEVRKEYKTYEDYYAYDGKTMQRIKKDKAFIENLLADRKDKVDTFITENKLKLRSFDEIQKVIEFYNAL
jgi:hypothetical protein